MSEIKLEKLIVSSDRVDYWFSVTEDLKRFFKQPMHMFAQYDRCIERVPESILVIPFWEILCKLHGLQMLKYILAK